VLSQNASISNEGLIMSIATCAGTTVIVNNSGIANGISGGYISADI
jgi:hypothetical protein